MKSIFAASAALLVFGTATAQDTWESQVRQYLNNAAQLTIQEGYEPAAANQYGRLADDASETMMVSMQVGYTYRVIGACDNDCSDLDIVLRYENGEEIISDVLTDSFPIVDFEPRTSGQYQVEVRMYECSVSPCRYGVMVLRK